MLTSNPGWMICLFLGLIIGLGLLFRRIHKLAILPSISMPALSYEEALQWIVFLRAQEPLDMKQVCRLYLLSHEKKMERAIILVHGYTNCPKQFLALGQRFYDLGYNVLIAPLPYHGLADSMTGQQARLRAMDLVRFADAVVDITQGLGRKVDIAGISGGGLIAAYAAQYRKDVNCATLLAPAFGLKQIPAQMTAVFVHLLSLLPNVFIWWDPLHKQAGAIRHAYPRFSTHALAQTLLLGMAVRSAARRQAPCASRLLVVTNAHDPGVNNGLIAAILRDWRRHHSAVTTYEFPAYLKLEHDFIEPENPKAQVDVVYQKLIELMIQ